MKRLSLRYPYYYSGSGFSALSGETSFLMSDIAQENLTEELYIAYEVPGAANCPLMVYLHGWSSGGGIVGAFATDAITYLKSQGIGILGVGMRGRNTGVAYANDGTDVEEYRDASGLEMYDVYASINYFIDNIAAAGQINSNKIFVYGVSGGGGNAHGLGSKFPDLFSVIVSFYGIPKYGTYTDDPDSAITSWYSDNLGFQSAIQKAVSGAPLGSGIIDAAYLSRDHTRSIQNFTGKLIMYHDTGDVTVFDDGEDLAKTNLLAAGKTEGVDFDYYRSTDGTYAHGQHALDVTYYDGSFGMQWLTDALTKTKQDAASSGTLHVAGFVRMDAADVWIWIRRFRKNVAATPRAQAMISNQGKFFAATVVYNNTAETYAITPIIPSTSDQFFFIEITKGVKTVTALVSALDTVTISPMTLASYPLSLSAYDWKVYFDFSSASNYVLDDASKVSNVWDLTGNDNFAFQQTRATRAAIVSGSMDNGVMYLAGTVGTLTSNVDLLEFTGAFTIVFSCDPDAATVASLADAILGSGAGGTSGINFDVFNGKLRINIDTETGVALSNATPANTNVGKQAWYFRRDAANAVYAKVVNSTATYDYGNIGTLTGTFRMKTIGTAASAAKAFSGKIYKIAAANEDIGNTDATSIISNWYTN